MKIPLFSVLWSETFTENLEAAQPQPVVPFAREEHSSPAAQPVTLNSLVFSAP